MRLTLLDLVLYACASIVFLTITLGFPPAALLWLLVPRWHRGRVARRRDRAATAELYAIRKFAEKLRPPT